MAPVRRYLRITKYSVLEVRIYSDPPAIADSWLLRRGDPALPRVIQAVRPLVLPKLREENERAKNKGKASKRGVKDTVVQGMRCSDRPGASIPEWIKQTMLTQPLPDDFEVSIFLTENSTRHSLLTKHKTFTEKPAMKSNSNKLTGWLTSGNGDAPIDVDADTVVRHEEDDETINLRDIPEAESSTTAARSKRQRSGDDEPLFVDDVSDASSDGFQIQRSPASKRTKTATTADDADDEETDDKKMGINTSYDGFAIYGRILCLVVKRRGARAGASTGQQMLESWVSTQAAQDAGIVNEDDEG